MADAVRDLFMSFGFSGSDAVKGLEDVNKKADQAKESIEDIGISSQKMGITFDTSMDSLDKNFGLWESNASKFTSTLEKKQKRIELLKDKTKLLQSEINDTSGELAEATEKYGKNTEAAKKLENKLVDLQTQQNKYNNEIKELNSFNWDGLDKIGDKLTDAGTAMTLGITTPLAGLGAKALQTTIGLEDSFAGVFKTVSVGDETQADLADLRNGLNELVTVKGLPSTITDIYGIAESAGQLGIERENILDFSEVMTKMGFATNMSSQDAATSLARFANITGMLPDDFDRLGSTIVHLGNNLATTESEIVNMSLRLSGAGKQIGLSEAEIMGFSGALSSVGIEAEAGGSAFSKVMIEMQNSVMSGGASLELFSAITGKTTDEFKDAFQKDAAGALVDFTEGLGLLQKEGFNTNEVLDQLGFSDMRVADALRRAANSEDVFREAIEMGNMAWNENAALTNEAKARQVTMASKIEVLKAKFTLLLDTLGKDLMPVFSKVMEVGGKLIDWFMNLDDSTRGTIVTIGGFAAAIGPVLVAVGLGAKGIVGFQKNIMEMGKMVKGVKTAFSSGGKALTFFTSPVGIAVLAIGALITIGILLYKNWDKISAWFKDKFPNTFEKVSEVIGKVKDFVFSHMEDFKTIFSGFKDFVSGIFSGDFSKAFEGLKTAFGGIGNIVGDLISPLKEKFPEAFDIISGVIGNIKTFLTSNFDNFKSIFSGFKDFFVGIFTGDIDKAFGGLETALEGLTNIFDSLIAPLEDKFPAVFKFLSGVIRNFKTTVSNIFGSIKQMFGGVVEFVKGVFSGNLSQALGGIGEVFKGSFDFIKNIVSGALNNIFGVFELVISPLQEKFPYVFSILSGTLSIFKDTVSNIIGDVQMIFGGIVDFVTGVFSGDWDLAWQGVKDIFGGIFSTLSDLLKAPLNVAINVINTAIGAINDKVKIEIPDWSPIYGGKSLGFNIPQIPMLATGTNFHTGGPAIVGEEGPELINLRRGSTVTTADRTKRILGGRGKAVLGKTRNSGSPSFNLTIKISKIIVGGSGSESVESIADEIEEVIDERLDKYFYKLRLKYPSITES